MAVISLFNLEVWILTWRTSASVTFADSRINNKFLHGNIPQNSKEIADGEESGQFCLLGEPAYPLPPQLMKGYTGGGSTLDGQLLVLNFHQLGWKLMPQRFVNFYIQLFCLPKLLRIQTIAAWWCNSNCYSLWQGVSNKSNKLPLKGRSRSKQSQERF